MNTNFDLNKRNILIRTPDQRLRVFVSSTLKELSDERIAVNRAITRLRLAPVMFESGARPHPAQDLYQAYLAQSHIFIGIYWQSYGWVGPEMQISGLEDEYNRSTGLPHLIYLKTPAPRQDPPLVKLLNRIRDENSTSYKYFETPGELEELVEADLIHLLTEYFETARLDELHAEKFSEAALTNVPIPRNPLIGREVELKTACDLLLRDDVALVTLTGPAGTGKSRLAIHVELELREHFKDGVYMVLLESIRDPALVIPTIAKTLRLSETGGSLTLLDHLKHMLCDKQTLLLLDNFEQVLPAAVHVADLLESCPYVKILVTSRASLHLRAEKELPIPPLTLPPQHELIEMEPLSHYAAVQLFIQRCQAVKPDFQVTNENAPAIAEICHRLDGLPLALELAAARIKLLSPEALLARLENRFDILRGGTKDLPERQQTMYNAIEWSYSLLNENDRHLLQRLSVFNGGWNVDAALVVCKLDDGTPVDILDGLERLMDNNLLTPPEDVGGEPRMRMLESIREFAQQNLTKSGDAKQINQRYARYYLDLALKAELELEGADQSVWHKKVDAELDNFRQVMDWAIIQGESEAALYITQALWRYWWICGCWSEGFHWLKHSLAGQGDVPGELRAKALTQLGWFYCYKGEYQHALSVLREAMTLWQRVGDQAGQASALKNMGTAFLRMGRFGEAWASLEKALDLAKSQGDMATTYLTLELLGHAASKEGDTKRGNWFYQQALELAEQKNDYHQVAKLLSNLGDNFVIEGDYPRAEECFSRAAEICIKQENRLVGAYVSGNRSIIALKQGNYSKAFDLLLEATLVVKEAGSKEDIILSLEPFAYIAVQVGDLTRAARLFGASETLRISTGITRAQPMQVDYDTNIELLTNQLGETIFREAWELGSRMTLDQAIFYAIQRE